MKIRLKLTTFLIMAVMGLLFAFPFYLIAGEDDGGSSANVSLSASDLLSLMRANDSNDDDNKDDGSIFERDNTNPEDWNVTSGDGAAQTNYTGNYTGGTWGASSAYLQQHNGKTSQQVVAAGSQIAQLASTQTEDPETAGIAAAAGSGIGALGAIAGAAHYGSLASDYWGLYSKNDANYDNNQKVLIDIEAQIEAAKDADADVLEKLNREKTELEATMRRQEGAASNNLGDFATNTIFSILNIATAGAMGWMGYMQYEQAQKLADDEARCINNPLAVGCPGAQANTPGTQEREDVPRPQQDNPGFGNGYGNNGNSGDFNGRGVAGSGLLDTPSSKGSGLGDAGSFLAADGAFGSGNGQGKDDKDVDNGKGNSSDQAYGAGRGRGGSGYSSRSPSAPSFAGLDISKFLPSHLRGKNFNGRYAKVKNKKKNKSIILGKDSPSLFTRISKAHRKKAPEMSKGML